MVYGLVILVLMVPSTLIAFVVGEWIFSGCHINVAFTDPGVARAVVGSALYRPSRPVRPRTGRDRAQHRRRDRDIRGRSCWSFPPLMNVLPASWNDAASPYLPLAAGEAIMSTAPGNHLSPWVGLGLFCAYAAGALAVAAVLLVRRDT